MVIRQLQVERRTGKVRRSKTNVLPLCYATSYCYYTDAITQTSMPTRSSATQAVFIALSYARALLRYRRRVCLSVCTSHAGNASKLMIAGSCSFHRLETPVFLRPTFTPYVAGTPNPNPNPGKPCLEKSYVSMRRCHTCSLRGGR